MSDTRGKVTELLDAWSGGDAEALDQLMPLVIDDLRQMAGAFLAQGSPGHTLQPTALVNEAYLRIVGRHSVRWGGRVQFFAYMSKVMRRLLVDHARRQKALKKGGGAVRLSFDEQSTDSSTDAWGERGGMTHQEQQIDLLALDEALESLAAIDPRQGRIVELRYFGGLTIEETAQMLRVSDRTVKREWRTARLWLLHALSQP